MQGNGYVADVRNKYKHKQSLGVLLQVLHRDLKSPNVLVNRFVVLTEVLLVVLLVMLLLLL